MANVSIIIPAYNEESAIGSVLETIRGQRGVLNPESREENAIGTQDSRPKTHDSVEVIVVDDGSTDRTAEIAASHGARVLRHPINTGYGHSIKDGIRAAAGELIILMDADGTYPIDRIPDLVTELARGYHMVVGAREGSAYRGGVLKVIARSIFKALAQFTTGNRVPDVNSGFRAFRRSEVLPYLDDLCNGFSFTTTITLVYMFTGKIVGYMPIAYQDRVGRSKVRIVGDSLRTLQYMVEAVVHYNPPKIFLLLSIVAFLWGALGVLWMGPMSLFAGGLTALVIFAIGLVAEGLRRTPK